MEIKTPPSKQADLLIDMFGWDRALAHACWAMECAEKPETESFWQEVTKRIEQIRPKSINHDE